MCTSIVEIIRAEGKAKGKDGWFEVSHSVVTYDHPHFAMLEDDSINIDFVDRDNSPDKRAAVEMSLESAKELHAALARTIEAAEREERENRGPRLRAVG